MKVVELAVSQEGSWRKLAISPANDADVGEAGWSWKANPVCAAGVYRSVAGSARKVWGWFEPRRCWLMYYNFRRVPQTCALLSRWKRA